MKLKLGQKIKSLRVKRGITQEMLAYALGVSNQAVSRWEAEGGYPDTELLPSIANYFGISMDELFGYCDEREKKIQEIMDKADEYLTAQDDMTDCISLLRDAVREFPRNAKLLVRLAYALNMDGNKKHGICGIVRDRSDYPEFDGQKNQKNEELLESMGIFEMLLNDSSLYSELPQADRYASLHILIHQYIILSRVEKAISLAEKQPSLMYSREILLSACAIGEEHYHYVIEAIALLSQQLISAYRSTFRGKMSLSNSIADKKIDHLEYLCCELIEAISST